MMMEADDAGSWSSPPDNGTSSPAFHNASSALDEAVARLHLHQRAYRDFTTTIQVLILVGSLLSNGAVLWCTCHTNVFRSATNLFIKNLACAGICAGVVCVPFDLALGSSPACCLWLRPLLLCQAVKFLHRLFCSATVLSFTLIALDRYYSVLYPLERKISDARSRDLLIYVWVHAAAVSAPVFAVSSVSDVYAAASCSDQRSAGQLIYTLTYSATTLVVPLALVFLVMALIRRALSSSQKKKVIIAALRTPQSGVAIPYVSQREAELHAALLAMVLVFALCSAPYSALVVCRDVLGVASVWLQLTALWLPKVSLLTNPLLLLTVNRSLRRRLLDVLAQLHRRYSRRNTVSLGEVGGAGGEGAGRSGSQLLEMFHIGQQQIFKPSEDEEDDVSALANSTPKEEAAKEEEAGLALPKHSPIQSCAYSSSSQVAPATPTDPEDAAQFGPFELPPQWLPETRNSKKRLLPPLGNTPEELIQSKPTRARPERRISRNNKVSTFPSVDP